MRLALAGDTMLGRLVAARLETDPGAELFTDGVAAVIRGADAFVLNLECAVSERGDRWPDPHKPFFFRAPPVAVEALTSLGVDAVTLANNHALDYGREALLDTIHLLTGAGIAVVGAGRDEAEAHCPRIIERAGTRIGIVGVTDHPAAYAADVDVAGVAYAALRHETPRWLLDTVADLRADPDVDVVVVTPHWGPNMVEAPLPHVRRVAGELLDAGATLVAGHSAHVFHGVVDRVLYDLGDFLDDYAVDPVLRNDLGLLVVVAIEERIPTRVEAVPIALDGAEVMITTDGFTVQPLEFPGGDIGSLAVHGTTNDLAVAGAKPLYLTLNAFIEEGLEIALLDRIVASLARAAEETGVRVMAGDTKVLKRGEGGGIYLATTGVGVRMPGRQPSIRNVEEGDVMILSGSVGDHGTAVMLAREDFGLRGDVVSDAGSVLPLAEILMGFDGLRFMRDPTRGGIASIAHEILRATGQGVRFNEHVPVRDPVRAVCEMLGYDPYYLACEGRVLAVVRPDQADDVVAALRDLEDGRDAAIVGTIGSAGGRVTMQTAIGGERFLEELEDDPLPRIC